MLFNKKTKKHTKNKYTLKKILGEVSYIFIIIPFKTNFHSK